MRVVVVTGHKFGTSVLDALAERCSDIEVAIAYMADPAAFARLGPRAEDFSKWPTDPTGLFPVLDPTLQTHAADICSRFSPDLVIVAGWPRLLTSAAIDQLTQDGRTPVVGMHPSPLPYGRGLSPIPNTVIDELRSSAVCAFKLTEIADAGPLYVVERFSVADRAHAADVFKSAADAHGEAAVRMVRRLLDQGSLTGWEQIQSGAAAIHYWKRVSKKDRILNAWEPFNLVDKRVRAYGPPYGGALLDTENGLRTINHSEWLDGVVNNTPGHLHLDGPWFILQLVDGRIALRLDGAYSDQL